MSRLEGSTLIIIHMRKTALFSTLREWVETALNVFLALPWSQRRTAATCLSSIVHDNPHWSDVLIAGLNTAVRSSEFNVRAVLEALQCVATPTHPQKEALAVSTLLLTHHPDIGIANVHVLYMYMYIYMYV